MSIPPAAKWCNKGGQVVIRLAQVDTVVAIPGIREFLPSVLIPGTVLDVVETVTLIVTLVRHYVYLPLCLSMYE